LEAIGRDRERWGGIGSGGQGRKTLSRYRNGREILKVISSDSKRWAGIASGGQG